MSRDLRIIFIGTPDFAVESLDRLVKAKKNIVAVITAPDKKAGRGRKLNESAVKKYAQSHQLPILQPSNLKDESFLKELSAYEADLQIVVAFRMLPEAVWNMPQFGTFNLHASLLPNYRGAAPINWAIINGEKETGVTTFFLKHKIDTGDIIQQQTVAIDERETAGSLHDKLMQIGGSLVVETVEQIEEGNVQMTPQEAFPAKEAPKIFKESCKINWAKPTLEVDRLIRGMSPYPTAWGKLLSKFESKQFNVKIFEAKPSSEMFELKPGTIKLIEGKLIVGCGDGLLEILSLQLEGKKRMLVRDLVNGFAIHDYAFF